MSAAQTCRIGAAVALLAVSAMVTVPLGPVPFTLQTLVLAMLPAILGGRGAVAAVGLYLLAGALGLPVFSGFSGGVGQLLGPTGGFLWGLPSARRCFASARCPTPPATRCAPR